jgi:septum formation protein
MLILASASPRRKELLSVITPHFITEATDCDETYPAGLSAGQALKTIATRKALAARRQQNDVVIGADTMVFVDPERMKIPLGKPKTTTDARKMLSVLSGRTHVVVTGVCVLSGSETVGSFKQVCFHEATQVEFFPLTDDEITAYIATGEPFDKAGGYGIQEKGALLVKGITGDYFNVMGLPIARLSRVLQDFDW